VGTDAAQRRVSIRIPGFGPGLRPLLKGEVICLV
jgi:hypothetical protein